MFSKLSTIVDGKKVLILGMGLEGRSTLRVLSQFCKPTEIVLADSNEKLTEEFQKDYPIHFGPQYLDFIDNYDLIIKSPGIPRSLLNGRVNIEKVRSQTDIFLDLFSHQVIGITGTKGKSTTSSLLYSILKRALKHAVLLGNIGLPPFDFLEEITSETMIVFELSSHQLDDVHHAPHISVILNLFEEHLDHYGELSKYYQAKLQIAKFQNISDFLIYNGDDVVLDEMIKKEAFNSKLVKFSGRKTGNTENYVSVSGVLNLRINNSDQKIDIKERRALPGNHNATNALAVAIVCKILNVPKNFVADGIKLFEGLPHRLEFIGEFGGIRFYDDSISTIPQATIEAVKTLTEVDSLILGGKDRGINYQPLVDFIPGSGVRNLFCIGEAGRRIHGLLKDVCNAGQKLHLVESFDMLAVLIRKYTEPGRICLLSPAAPSYDWFANFAERGDAFKKIARNF